MDMLQLYVDEEGVLGEKTNISSTEWSNAASWAHSNKHFVLGYIFARQACYDCNLSSDKRVANWIAQGDSCCVLSDVDGAIKCGRKALEVLSDPCESTYESVSTAANNTKRVNERMVQWESCKWTNEHAKAAQCLQGTPVLKPACT